MKRKLFLVALLVVLSALAGYCLSKASFVGRVGISLFYQQYSFLKVWWQGGGLILIVWLTFFFVQGKLGRKRSTKFYNMVQLTAVFMAVVGLCFTYQDFRNNLAHRWLGERFHLGGYLFWIGWIIISVFYLTEKTPAVLSAESSSTTTKPPTPSPGRVE